MIIVLDSITSCILFTTVVILFIKWLRDKRKSRFVVLGSFLLLFFSTVFNLPEHINNISKYDKIEVLFDILFIPTLILAINISLLDKELINKTISESKFKAVFNQAFSLVGLLDNKGRVLDSNQKALSMVDTKIEDVYGIPLQDTPWWSHSGAERQKIIEAIEKAKTGEFCNFETTHLNTEQKARIIDFSITPVFINSSELTNFIVEGRDITNLKEIQHELEQHKNNLEELVIEKTEDLETAYEELKATNDELFGKNEIINEQNTELKETLRFLKDAQDQLVRAEKMASLGILTAGVSHEINNPLNYLMGAFYGLEDYFLEYGSKEHEKTSILLEGIKTGIERISNIVKGLNQLSANNHDIYEICDLHTILDNCLSVLQAQSRYKASVIKNFTPDRIEINGHSGNLHQTFINVLNNAIYAIKDTGTISISTRKLDKQAIIEIADDGTGIEAAYLNKITEPFFTTKDPGEGTGLGLSIALTIIQDHQGDISFESEVNKGTKVTITLPII